jgi:hypothetical protein
VANATTSAATSLGIHCADEGGILQRPALRHFGVQGDIAFPADEAKHAETPTTTYEHDDKLINVVEYECDEGEVLLNESEVELVLTMDSGSVVNVMHPEDLPAGCEIQKKENSENFVGANGGAIINHGMTDTQLTPDTGQGQPVRCRWDCAEVTRPLISTGVTCDSGYEVLHTSTEACVVPKGTLSKYLESINVVQRYKRQGKGLYTMRTKMRAPKSSFTRPSPIK